MNKSELIKLIHSNTNLSLQESKDLTKVILDGFKKDLASGKGIKFSGVCSLTPVLRQGRFYYPPSHNNKPLYVSDRYKYKLYVSKGLLIKLNSNSKFSFR